MKYSEPQPIEHLFVARRDYSFGMAPNDYPESSPVDNLSTGPFASFRWNVPFRTVQPSGVSECEHIHKLSEADRTHVREHLFAFGRSAAGWRGVRRTV